MSKIETMIKELQEKKLKIDYISYVADLIKNDTKCVDFKSVQKEMVSQIEPLLVALMDSVESDTKVELSSDVKASFEQEEVQILKRLVNQIQQKATTPNTPASQTQPVAGVNTPSAPTKPVLSNQDKMNFAMTHRNLGNKRVQVLSPESDKIHGLVVGLDAPFVIVKTDTGPTIEVPLEKIVPL